MTTVHRAAWVLPISRPPIRGGWVAVDNGRIVGAGREEELPPALRRAPRTVAEGDGARSDVAVLPGLVNAHAHLELSWMRGLVPPGESMPAWASALMALRRSSATDPAPAIEDAIAGARAAGTSLVADVANTFDTYVPIARSALRAVVFRELIGFRAADPEGMIAAVEADVARLPPASRVRVTLVPHAPYSVSGPLIAALARHAADRPVSIHLAESRDEEELLRDGTGAWRDVLESVGAWSPAWRPPACGPVEYIERLGLLSPKLLAVHCVQLRADGIARLARAGATIVTCPRSNEWTGAGAPPVDAFYASGARVAIGTDSLASGDTLSLFDEMAAVRRAAPHVPATRILESATRAGAQALGFGAELGSIERGRRAELLAVQVPAGLDDVEEYLVSGVPAGDVRWLSEDTESWTVNP
jgi:cytosine/adenosine deaminase-related metal-dependent hydrolase